MKYISEETDGQLFEDSEVQKFYENTVIFITGASGFLGKLLIEKLLRNCPRISKIYVLLRDKKCKTSEERLSELFDDVLFERARRCNSKIFNQVEVIRGDCSLPELGVCPADKQKLIEEVNVIFHVAAAVKFDEKLSLAVNINIRSTRDILQMAQDMKELKGFVYVSTAFSFCVRNEICEEVYGVKFSADKLIKMSEILTETEMETLKQQVTNQWPNTYVFTKAVAENVVKDMGKNLPVAILRPSIVIGTKSEPMAGWADNHYGANGILIGSAIGLLRTMHCDPDVLADLVPADYVVNAIIVAACGAENKRAVAIEETSASNIKYDKLEKEKEKEIDVYNYVGSLDWPITWRKLMRVTMEYGLAIPSPHCIWYFCFTLNRNKYIHILYIWLLHYIPACIVDICATIIGKKPRLLQAYRKIHKFMSATDYFATREWKFRNNNVRKLWKNLNDRDRELFPFDLSILDWDSYMYTYVRGLRVYLLKDPLETLPEGKKKYLKLKIAHYTVVTVLILLLVKVIYSLMCLMFNLL